MSYSLEFEALETEFGVEVTGELGLVLEVCTDSFAMGSSKVSNFCSITIFGSVASTSRSGGSGVPASFTASAYSGKLEKLR